MGKCVTVDTEAVCALLQGIVEQLVDDARIDITRWHTPGGMMEADYRRRKALLDFERMKQDPEGDTLLGALSAMTGAREVDILDALLGRAGIPWDLQPDVLADGPRLRLYDALGLEGMDLEEAA
jgi:hypothetical protein